jgi:hypothetical protein
MSDTNFTYSEGMEECPICVTPVDEASWFPLDCCKHGVCLACVCRMHPKACPFCRTRIEHDEDNCGCRVAREEEETGAVEAETENPDARLLAEAEDEWVERSMRRVYRRMRRLELREMDRQRNTLWTIIRRNCVRGGESIRRDFRRFIREEINMIYNN